MAIYAITQDIITTIIYNINNGYTRRLTGKIGKKIIPIAKPINPNIIRVIIITIGATINR
jgi:spore coat polysaccharide biosynthesis predicted glycosyltransferase SpsG